MNIFLISNKKNCKPAEFRVGDISVHESDLCVVRDGCVSSIYLIETEPSLDGLWDDNAHIEIEGNISDFKDGFALFFENTKKRNGNKKILKEIIDLSSEVELTRFLKNALDILQYQEDRWNVSYIKGIYKLFERSKESDKEVVIDIVGSEEDDESYESKLHYAESIESDNPEGAFLIYKELADKGFAEAQYRLGKCYRLSIGVAKNPIKELYWFKRAAEQGHVDAQFRLAKLYEKSFTPDYKKAFKWYKKAAEQGDKKAINELITCYKYGRGTEKDSNQVNFWQSKLEGTEEVFVKGKNSKIDKASKTQYENVLDLLAEGTCESDRNAFVLLNRIAVTRGDAQALCKLGYCYESGTGTEQSYQKAFKYYKLASTKGSSEADLKIAYFFLNGRYVGKSLAQAYIFFKKAADKGNNIALFNLGQFYENGIYVEKSMFKAKYYYKEAADKEHAEASFLYAQLITEEDLSSLILKLAYLEKAYRLGVTKSVENAERVRKKIELIQEYNKQIELERHLKEQEILKRIEKQEKQKIRYLDPKVYKFYEILKQYVKINSYIATESVVELFSDIYSRYPKEFREARREYEKKYKNSIYSKNVDSQSVSNISENRKNLTKKEQRKSLLIEFLQKKGYKYIDNTDKEGAFWIIENESTDLSYLEKNGISVIFRPQGGKSSGRKPSWLVSF